MALLSDNRTNLSVYVCIEIKRKQVLVSKVSVLASLAMNAVADLKTFGSIGKRLDEAAPCL
jgi:hypothetical protein